MPTRNRILILLVSIAALLTLAACGSKGSSLPGDPKAAVIQAARNQVENLPLRLTMISDEEGAASTNVIEYESPERIHVTFGDMELIIRDGSAWRKEGDVWTEDPSMAAVASSLSAALDADTIETMMGTVTDATRVGEEELDGEKTTIYEFHIPGATAGSTSTTRTRVWIRNSDSLPVKQEITSDASGTESVTTMTMEYDDSIKIEAPQ